MHINWYGQGCFKIQSKDLDILISPFDVKESGLRTPRIKKGLILAGKLNQKTSQDSSAEIFSISAPGEYEKEGIFIYGLVPKDDYPVIIYRIEIEGVSIVHLGGVNHLLSDEIVDELGDVDVLMIPVGGKNMLGAEKAAKVISQLEPRIVIPMNYKIPGLKVNLEGVDHFCKEMGVKKTETDKIIVKKNNLPQETEITILKP